MSTTWNRVWEHPSARIEPLNGPTMRESTLCAVWEGRHRVATAKRLGERCWGVYPSGSNVFESVGASALQAVTAWLGEREFE